MFKETDKIQTKESSISSTAMQKTVLMDSETILRSILSGLVETRCEKE